MSQNMTLLGPGSLAKIPVAEYDATRTYKAGEWRLHDGVTYRAKQDIDTAEAWNASHWEEHPSMSESALRIAEALEGLQPINPCTDIDISISANGWSNESPYTYTYTNNHISTGCVVKVSFLEGSEDSTKPLYLEYEKVTNGVRFVAPIKPTSAIPVRIHIQNADATSTAATSADQVSTNAVSGAANVGQALGVLSNQIGTLNSKIATIPKIYKIEITLPNTTGKFTVSATFPTGTDRNNTFVLSTSYKSDENNWIVCYQDQIKFLHRSYADLVDSGLAGRKLEICYCSFV